MSIDDIYLEIAQDISDSIEDEWGIAVVTFEIEEDAGEFDCIYKPQIDSEREYDFDIGYSTYKAFERLHKITTQGGVNKWNRAKFTLFPTGKFSIDFEWDQNIADEIEANS